MHADDQASAHIEALSSIEVPADHPAFAGHFPGAPVLPGVVLLDGVLRAARHAGMGRDGDGWQVEQVKFLGAVGPGSIVNVRLQAQGRAAAFELTVGARIVARGRLAVA